MRQDWSHLLFLHWPVPAESVRPWIPEVLDVDTFEGQAYVGLVPFTMTGVRPVWAPATPGLSRFHEVNVRTYVHHRGRDPGVWFFSLDAASAVAVVLARRIWHLPYYHARMSLTIERTASGTVVRYASARRGPGPAAGCAIRYAPSGVPAPAVPGTLASFLAERYILYCHTGSRLRRGRVHHTPYPLQPAVVERLDESLLAAAGLARPDVTPLAHYAAGVRVRVFPLEWL